MALRLRKLQESPELQIQDTPLFDQAAPMNWLKHFGTVPQHSFVVHGEAQTACAFADLIADRFDWNVVALAT